MKLQILIKAFYNKERNASVKKITYDLPRKLMYIKYKCRRTKLLLIDVLYL